MMAHQLELFGGPLKPPKKIKVDDDEIPVATPKKAPLLAPLKESVPEAETKNTEAEIEKDPWETALEETKLTTKSGTIGDEESADYPTEAVLAAPEILEKESNWWEAYEAEQQLEAQSKELVIVPEAGIEAMLNADEIAFTDEAIFEEGFISTKETAGVEQPDEDIQPENEEITAIDIAAEPALLGTELDEAIENLEPALALPKAKKYFADGEDGLNIPPDEELFKRQYYSMRETSAMFGVNQSLLRFWENEFEILQPKKNKKGDRYFRPVDIKNLVLIHNLLRVRKFTLEGAKEYLNKNKKAADSFELVRRLEKIKSFLLELKAGL